MSSEREQATLDGSDVAPNEIDRPLRTEAPTKDSIKEAFGVVGTPRSALIDAYETLGEIEDASRVELVRLEGVGHSTADKIEDAAPLHDPGSGGYLEDDGLRTDGGQSVGGTERPDPEDDPFACSRCGQPLGTVKRVDREDYCDACLSEMGFAVEGYR